MNFVNTLRFKNGEQAQLHTLEAVMAATIMISIIVFAVQATSLTPLTSSTANAHIEAQLQTIGQDMLNALDYSQYDQKSNLKNDILNWDGYEYVWEDDEYDSISDNENDTHLENSSIANMLLYVAMPRGIAHNVQFTHMDESGRFSTRSYIYNGAPSDNAVIVSRKIVLSNPDIADTADFFKRTGIYDVDGDTDFYGIVDVKLTLWRM